MPDRSHIYFASDLHLGMHPAEDSLQREKLFIRWLEEIRHDAKEIWLLGDTFDYWFEYRRVVPRGFTRFLSKLAELREDGIEIHIFTGNHDVWMFGYLPEETGVEVHRNMLMRTWGDKQFLLGHGDGLLRSDRGYRLLQRIFRNRFLQWCYARIHPNGSGAFAQWWSRKSRNKKGAFVPYLGTDNEHQVIYARNRLRTDPDIAYFVFGHRHIPYNIRVAENSRVICLGDWIGNFSYGVFDGNAFRLECFVPGKGSIISEDAR